MYSTSLGLDVFLLLLHFINQISFWVESFECVISELAPLPSPLLSSSWLLQDSGESLPWLMESWKSFLIHSCLGFLSVLRSFGIWPSYWTASPIHTHTVTHRHCLSVNISSFNARLINRSLFCASQQSLLNPVTPLCACVFGGCLCVHVFVHGWAPLHLLEWDFGQDFFFLFFPQTHRDWALLTVGHLFRDLSLFSVPVNPITHSQEPRWMWYEPQWRLNIYTAHIFCLKITPQT